MKVLVLAVGLFANVQLVGAQAFTAEEKREELWSKIVESEYERLPDLESGPVNQSSLCRTVKNFTRLSRSFDNTSDVLEDGQVKWLHPFGSVAVLEFIPDSSSQFTGLLAEKQFVLGRFSLAGGPKQLGGFVPGIALKFFISGEASENIHAMDNLEGQGKDFNFFARTFKTSIDHPKSAKFRFLSWIFSFVHNPPVHLPTTALCRTNSIGQKIANPYGATELHFKPHSDVKDLFNSKSKEDFRQILARIPHGNFVYEVVTKKGTPVGKLKVEQPFVASEFGDKKLFFRHRRA